MKNVFDNPKLFIKQINDNIKINKTIKFNGKSFICVFFTKNVLQVVNSVFLNQIIEN